MSNQHIEIQRIRRLIAVWISEIRLNNYENYYDINKVGEHLSRQILNLLYDYELEDLNKIKKNYPGLDIGDSTNALVAYQVTSRTDTAKVIKNLGSVTQNNFHATFTNGIRFLILNDTKKISFSTKAKKQLTTILPSFKILEDILYPEDLIKRIEYIYEEEADLIKFNQIKIFLEKEIIPIISTKPIQDDKIDNLTSLLNQALDKFTNQGQPELKISNQFFLGNLKPPTVKIVAERYELIEKLWQIINSHDALWLKGTPGTGKTSLAVLLTKKASEIVLWIECRDVKAEQLIEHILNLLSTHFHIDISNYYSETLENIFSDIKSGTLIVLNDLPSLHEHFALQKYLGQLVSVAVTKGLSILITSNYSPFEQIFKAYGLDAADISIPSFEDKDTEAVLLYNGASQEIATLFSGLITRSTDGHPILVQSAVKFLREHDWKIDENTMSSIFSGKFGGIVEKESYVRILEHTTDTETRELLYRMRSVIGGFSLQTIQRISSINPAINHPAEKLNQIKDIWVQGSENDYLQLSPLIKILDGNLSPEIIKQINKQLGLEIIEKKNISQLEASKAILYFSIAEEYNQAAFVLLKVLLEFAKTPELFFDWGFDLYWYHSQLPQKVLPIIKLQIRIFQINISTHQKNDTTFLVSDLRNILSKEDTGLLGQFMSEMLFFQLDMQSNPLIGMLHLANAQTARKELASTLEFAENDFFNQDIFNVIWISFSQLHRKEEYEEWFNVFRTLELPYSIIDTNNNELYVMAAVSIYRNAVLKNQEEAIDITAILKWLIVISESCNLHLFSAFALKYLAKYLIEQFKDFDTAAGLIRKYEIILHRNPLYKFLFYSELGRQYFFEKDNDDAYYYLSGIRDIMVPDIYTEKLDYLIAYFQVAYQKEQLSLAYQIATEALKLALSSPNYLLEDKVKLYGESAIGLSNENKLVNALNQYSEGYRLLLENFSNNEEQQALVIRYGNALKYMNELLESGEPKSFGGEKNVIPEPGYFYRTNDKILEGGFYFEERKFMVASILQSSYESISDINNAKFWAYKSIELAQQLEEGEFIPILQGNIHYLIEDRKYRQAYNLMAFIENFYSRLKQKVEAGEHLDETLQKLVQHIKQDDLSVYFFILLPIAFSFSLDIVQGNVTSEQYPMMIADVFNSDRYPIKDAASFEFAKKLFEEIMINRISFQQLQTILEAHTGEIKEIFYIIGYILLSSFTGATEAINLQLAIIVQLDKTMKGMKALYRFSTIPFFESFWKQKLITHSTEFTGKEHLRLKGFKLIETSKWDKKIPTIFRVFTNHLNVTLTTVVSNFLDS